MVKKRIHTFINKNIWYTKHTFRNTFNLFFSRIRLLKKISFGSIDFFILDFDCLKYIKAYNRGQGTLKIRIYWYMPHNMRLEHPGPKITVGR